MQGTLILDNHTASNPKYTNSYTGATTVNAGTLQIGNDDGEWYGSIGYATNLGSPITVNSPGTVEYYQTDLSNMVFNVFSGNGSVLFKADPAPWPAHTYVADYAVYHPSPSFTGTVTLTTPDSTSMATRLRCSVVVLR